MMSCQQFQQIIFHEDSSPQQLHLFAQEDSLQSMHSCSFEDILKRMDVVNRPNNLFYNDGLQQRKARDKAQEVKLTKRVNNTIFKTSLSQYRKSFIDQLSQQPQLQWLKPILHEACEAKNQSVFPKLNFMVRQLQLQNAINERWSQRIQKLLYKKQRLVDEGKYQRIRFQKLQQTICNMNECMRQLEFEKGFKIYWGNYRQYSKHESSKQQVFSFCKKFKTAVSHHQSLQEVNIQSKDKKYLKKQREGKKGKKGKSRNTKKI